MARMELTKEERRVQTTILAGQYEQAKKILAETKKNIRTVYQAIFGAVIAFAMGDEQLTWKNIETGLREDNCNYELYMMLGDYYASRNLQQAYLCYENALFYCDVPEDRTQIQGVIDNLREQGVCVPKAAIVILSYNLLDMTEKCIESIRRTTPESAREIIVVDNASADGSVEWLKKQSDIKLLCNSENQGFPKGCNQGIALAEKNSDIFLLNNDTVMTDNALFWLRMGLYENEQNGSTGCVSNFVSNNQTIIENGKTEKEYHDFAARVNVPMRKPYLNKVYLVGFALLIKRTVLDATGMLDERFSPGNFEDNDICMRISLAGYRNVLCKNSFIIHWGSKSFGKEPQKYNSLMQRNQDAFFKKWSLIGLEPVAYWNARMDIVKLLEQQGITDEKIMVIGTGCGSCLSCLQDRFPLAQIYGIEQREYMAQIANGIADTVWTNLDEWSSEELEETFDIIIVNDSLENTINPEGVLAEIARMLKKDGKMIISFGNSNHFSRIGKQLGERRLFTRQRMYGMLAKAKLSGDQWGYTQTESNLSDLQGYLQKLEVQFPGVDEEELRAYRWIVTVRKQRNDICFGNKMVVCIPTYEHPEVVEDVLAHCAETYKRYGLDVYYYDSSRNDATKQVIASYQKKGYENLHYIYVDQKTLKAEQIFKQEGLEKKYTYMWYLRNRCWCEENTLQLMYQAVNEQHDLIFLDVGHPESECEFSICRNANEFYHRCGDYATSMDTAIFNTDAMLRLDMNCFRQRYVGEYSSNFFQFIVIFDGLSQKKDPDICLLAGENVAIHHSKMGQSMWGDKRIAVWGERWIQANESLPKCYTNREEIIKRTASFPWLLGSVEPLVELQRKGILTPEYFEKIKVWWERVSNIPLYTLRKIAYGEFDVLYDSTVTEGDSLSGVNLLKQTFRAVLEGRMKPEAVPMYAVKSTVMNEAAQKGLESTLQQTILEEALKAIENLGQGKTKDIEVVVSELYVIICLLTLINK